MRALVVRPGPAYSVADVHRGLVAGLRANGVQVVDFFYDVLLEFHSMAHIKKGRRWVPALPQGTAMHLAGEHLQAAIYRVWPDVIIFTSGFWVHPEILGILKSRPHHTVLWATESPYEDDKQAKQAEWVDTVILNDPTNLESYRAHVNPRTWYLPQSYDPDLHAPGPGRPEWRCDVAHAGTMFPSRVQFMEAVDWTGVDLKLAGMFGACKESPLTRYAVHHLDECLDNVDTVDLYRSAKMSFNLYRREANQPDLVAGWAMGPREVELAATGTFFLRDPRPEGDEVLGMLPTYTSPEEFEHKMRWYLRRDELRAESARLARAAIADRTFPATTARLLQLVESPVKAA